MAAITFPRLLKRPEVEKVVGLSCSSLYRLMSQDDFPRPVRLGGRAVAWRATDIADWLESRPSTANETPVTAS